MTPELTIEHEGIDMICKGEGEFALLDLCEAIDKKMITQIFKIYG